MQSSPVGYVSMSKSAWHRNSISNDFKKTASSSTRKSFILFSFLILPMFLIVIILPLTPGMPGRKLFQAVKQGQVFPACPADRHLSVVEYLHIPELFLPCFQK